jgi:hypothetical protein
MRRLHKKGSAEQGSAGHFFPHGKKGLGKAFHLIIAIPIIILSITFFYIFAGSKLNIGQQSFIEADIAIVKLDEGLAGLQIPSSINAKQMDEILKAFFTKNNYELVVMPGQPNICTGDITCSFMAKSPYTQHTKTYNREIIIPREKGILTIAIKGELFE